MYIPLPFQKYWEVQELSSPDFESLVKSICHGIRGNRTRVETEEELLGHLEDTYERNIAIGKSEKEAFDASVASLGNTQILAQQLEAVHANSPAVQMKSAIWVFIIGFLLQKLELNVYAGMSVITDFIGIICWLAALYLMRNVNKNLKIAHISYTSVFLLYVINNCLLGYGIQNDIWGYAYVIASCILHLITQCNTYYGFIVMDRMYCGASEKRKPHLWFVLAYTASELVITDYLVLMNYGKTINFEGGLLFIIIVAVYVFILVQFVRLKNRLWDADARYGIDSFKKSSKAVFCMVVALSILCPVCFMYAYAVKDTPKRELIVHDIENLAEADAVRDRMYELGVDKETLAMLPDSEIINYKDALSMQFSSHGYMDGYIVCNIFDFYFADKNGDYSVRSLFVIEHTNCKYRMGLYYLNFDDSFSHLEPSDEKAVYVSVLQKQGNKYYAKKPINYKFDLFKNFSKVPNGFDFKAEEDQTIIFAMNHNIRDARVNFTMHQGLIFVYQQMPFSFMYDTVEQTAMASGNYDFHSFRSSSDLFMKSYYFMDTEMFQPEFVGQTYYQPEDFTE